MGGALSIYVERLGFARQLKYNTVEGGTQVGGSNRDALCIWQSTQPIAREESGQEIERGFGLLSTDSGDAAIAVVCIVGGEGRGSDVRKRSLDVLFDDVSRSAGWSIGGVTAAQREITVVEGRGRRARGRVGLGVRVGTSRDEAVFPE